MECRLMRVCLALLFGLLVAAPGAAQAGMPVTVKEKCAVGGESFDYTTTASYSTFGARPDGKPYGSWTFPLALPVCPTNGLVMYREFSEDEIARLPDLLASPEFVALRPAETPYYRAAWLAKALDPKAADRPWLLLDASWEADTDPVRKARYQAEFIAAATSAPAEPASLEWLALQARAINAQRELSRFDEAAAALKALPRDALTATSAAGDPAVAEQDDRQRAAWRQIIADLERTIARRDPSSEPLDMIPKNVAAAICVGVVDDRPPRDDPYCQSPALADLIRQFRGRKAATKRP